MTSETTRPTTTAGELTAGQHIILRGVTDTLCRVDHVHPFRRASNSSRQVMLLMTEASGDDVPFTRTWPADSRVTLATPEDLAAGEVASRRAAAVAALRALADDIEDRELPVPRYGLNVSAAVWTYAEVQAWAEYLGVEIRAGGTQKDIPVADREGDALAVHVQSQEPMPAAEPTGDTLADGITTLLDAATDDKPAEGAEHYHQAGTAGGPGECSAVCACGATFAGFDSQAEALAALNEHIAKMGAAEPVSADLSHAGVDRILAALAAEGIEVHYSETDGDTAIDIWLTDVELADGMPATALSWRDTEGWLLRHWAAFGGNTNTQAPDEKWPISAGGPAEVARDVAAILDESATADAQAGA